MELDVVFGFTGIDGCKYWGARSRVSFLKITPDNRYFIYIDGVEIEVDKETLDKIQSLL